jgi:hypothetical protein
MRPFGFEPGQFASHRRELLFEVLLRTKSTIAAEGVHTEIADEQRGEDIEAEHSQDGAAVPMGDHSP